MTRTSPRAGLGTALAVLALATLAAACGAERHGYAAAVPLTDPTLHRFHVGLDESAPPDATLGQVLAARVTDGGRHVVVLDLAAPFVKVFDGDGRFRTSFMRKGSGPGEARSPMALAVSGDSAVLVADASQTLSVTDLQGGLRAQARLPGVLALAAASPCPGEWLVYGPRMDGRGRTAPWLHRVRFTAADAVEVRSFMVDTVPSRISAGLAYGLVSDGTGVVVRHTQGARPRVLHLACAGGAPRVLYEGEAVPPPPPPVREGGRTRTTVTPGMRAPGGLAALPGGVVFAEKVFGEAEGERVDLTLLGAGSGRTLSVAGDYVIRDSRTGVGVLVSTNDPVPQVFLVKPEDFLGMFPAP
jgi:hypothetical protein